MKFCIKNNLLQIIYKAFYLKIPYNIYKKNRQQRVIMFQLLDDSKLKILHSNNGSISPDLFHCPSDRKVLDVIRKKRIKHYNRLL